MQRRCPLASRSCSTVSQSGQLQPPGMRTFRRWPRKRQLQAEDLSVSRWAGLLLLVTLLGLIGLSAPQALADSMSGELSSTHPVARSAIEIPDPPGMVQRRLKQLTGRSNEPGLCREPDLADPSPPEQLPDGRIRVTGTASNRAADCSATQGVNAAVWPSWTAFLRGDNPARELIRLYQYTADGQLTELNQDETPWDITIESWAGQEVLWGGAMIPTRRRDHAVLWEDNWTRRVWPFIRDSEGRWIRAPQPLFGAAPDQDSAPSFQDHSYGHQFISDEAGGRWVFYERVSEANGLWPGRTDIYARRMVSAIRASDEEHFILSAGNPAMRTAVRAAGDQLVEGPRPVRIAVQGEVFYLLGFSAGDFRSTTYGIHFAVSRHLLGPYRPYLTADRGDFLDLGKNIRERYGLSWGPGRPALFQDPAGEYWILFHATQPSVLGDFRNVYLAPIEMRLGRDGWPVLTLLDNNPQGAAPMTTLESDPVEDSPAPSTIATHTATD